MYFDLLGEKISEILICDIYQSLELHLVVMPGEKMLVGLILIIESCEVIYL